MIRVLVMLALVTSTAHAGDEPWSAGVSADQEAQANALFAEANALFSQQAHAPALVKYKAAIAIWDHPMIRFNMAVTLIRLDRIVEASEALERALRFGDAPFPPELYQQALAYQTLLLGRLGYIEVRCDLVGARVQLDGKPWFVAPSTTKIRVESGEHSVVAEKDGYLTEARRVVVTGGGTTSEKLTLIPLGSAMIVTYRHPRWIPWTVLGGGVAIAVTGGLGFYALGKRQMDDFRDDFFRQCPTGCESDLSMHPDLAAKRDRADTKYTLATGFVIGGGVIAIGGGVWAILNRASRSLPRVEVTKTSGGASARAAWSF